MSADDALREEIARAACEANGYTWDDVDEVTRSLVRTHTEVAILPIVARVEQEAYRRGQADGWDEGYARHRTWRSRHPIDDAEPEPTNPHRERGES